MSEHLINIINHILVYADGAVTDNPHMRSIDFRRRIESLVVKNPDQQTRTLRPGENFSVFENEVALGLNNTSILDLSIASASDSLYRLRITAGSGSFRTARATTGIITAAVENKNNAVAVFDFTGANLTAVQVGDIMRIKGANTYNFGSFAFNPINSGIWKVIGISGSAVSAMREAGQPFQGLSETVAMATPDVSFYADDKVTKGQKLSLEAGFSPASFRTYEIIDSTPTEIIFISTMAIPEETGVAYQNSGIIVYTATKKLIYIEVDQEVVVRFNGATDNSNKITPFKAGDKRLPGYLHKVGDTYSCKIVNNTINPVNVLYFTCE